VGVGTLRTALAAVEPQEVKDYELTSLEGAVRLSELFGAHDDLIVIHNMGVACSYAYFAEGGLILGIGLAFCGKEAAVAYKDVRG
jgi:hypothetical protein